MSGIVMYLADDDLQLEFKQGTKKVEKVENKPKKNKEQLKHHMELKKQHEK